MVATNETWAAPGPGMWEMDEAHQSAPYSGYVLDLFRTRFNLGISEASERYGTLIERFDMRPIDGWNFARVRIVGAPEKPGPLPPKWLFKLLFRVHPALRRRSKAASEAVTALRWRQDGEWWIREGREPMRARARALQAIDLTSLTDEQLAGHMTDVEFALTEGLRIHLRNAIAHWVGVGDWLASVSEWTGDRPRKHWRPCRALRRSQRTRLRIWKALRQPCGGLRLR